MAEQEPRELVGVKVAITSTIPPQHVDYPTPFEPIHTIPVSLEMYDTHMFIIRVTLQSNRVAKRC